MTKLYFGLFNLPWWGYVLVTLALTHITIMGVTIFLHRCQSHRALNLHPIVSHFFRFWLWLTTGMRTNEWVAIHRKHHAHSDKPGDPHSPVVFGLSEVLWRGTELYREESLNEDTLSRYAHGIPDDWIERHIYWPHNYVGIVIMLAIDLLCFGFPGLSIWAIQMMWIPFFAAGVINGIGHHFGYRNFECADYARNMFPWGILIGGEELHNNHHTYPTSAKLSAKWFEFDICWLYICILSFFKLADVKKTLPKEFLNQYAISIDFINIETLKSIMRNHCALQQNGITPHFKEREVPKTN
jgi:stearoyl-CoA desaturase (Delta-9 desaturase)